MKRIRLAHSSVRVSTEPAWAVEHFGKMRPGADTRVATTQRGISVFDVVASLGAVVGVMLGLGVALLVHWMRRPTSIRCPSVLGSCSLDG